MIFENSRSDYRFGKFLAKLGFLVLIFSLLQSACKKEQGSSAKYYGANTTKAQVNFESYFLFKTEDNFQGDASSVLTGPYREVVERELNQYLDFLSGIFLNYGDFAAHPGSLYGKPTIQILDAAYASEKDHLIKVRFSYQDYASFPKDLVLDNPWCFLLALIRFTKRA